MTGYTIATLVGLGLIFVGMVIPARTGGDLNGWICSLGSVVLIVTLAAWAVWRLVS